MIHAVVGPVPRILVVDDETALARAYGRPLSSRGYDVVTVEDAAEAIGAFATNEFDVVVTDVCMPGLDGVGLLRSIHARDADIPVILISGSPSLEIATAAMAYGVQRLLTKPVTPELLGQSVEQAVVLRRSAVERRDAAALVAQGRLAHAELAAAFQSALANLHLVVQPIVRPAARQVFGYEALLRSDEPRLSHPTALLEAAERLDRLPALGRAVRSAAARLVTELPDDVKLFVNLHPVDLADDDLLAPASPLFAHASRVVLEITERAALGVVTEVDARLAALRQAGFLIAVDDLGAGYAGLNSLASISPEVVKIDMALTRGIDAAPVKQKIVKLITTLCRELAITIVAEGIETTAEHETLAQLGLDLFQGYRFARPGRGLPDVMW